VHVRRALLLFAIVLALAALATSVTRPERDRDSDTPREPGSAQAREEAAAGPGAPAPSELRLPRRGRPGAVRLTAGRATTLVVPVQRDGQVEVPGLGLSEPATPLAPARFELLVESVGTYQITFTPADDEELRVLGRLEVDAG
jgi:hypothetical protein